MFRFSITDLGLFLGKSPATIRAWERKNFVTLPRVGANRSVTTDEVYEVALIARKAGRISEERLELVRDAVMCLRFIEQENE